jgi:hypothetical protein
MVNCSVCKNKLRLSELVNVYSGKIYCKSCLKKKERKDLEEEKIRDAKENAIRLKEKQKELDKKKNRALEAKIKQEKILKINSKWEYKLVEIHPRRGAMQATDVRLSDTDTSFLNKLGREGWELVNVVSLQGISAGLGMHASGATTRVTFTFKRRIN